ncbi:MAG: polyhydroxyalkanoate depolymerase [Alphaproteobacteria bacterium]|nr:polyhydroxyalkanoate depolymerase [Alphaproteobacteria bacterium]
MLYPFYEMNHAAMAPIRFMAEAGLTFWGNEFNPLSRTPFGRQAIASLQMFERATRRYDKPEFDITSTKVSGKDVAVREEIVWQMPFCDLLNFAKDMPAKSKPQTKLLMVAPMSGHFATLLKGTVQEMLPDYDVYVTDWHDARNVPLAHGRFDLDDYSDTLISILQHLGTRAHVMAVCQPSVPVMAAVTLMNAAKDPLAPLSMVLMGGPIDTQRNPTAVNKLAQEKGLQWLRDNMVMNVTGGHPGAGREVYPGFMQLGSFLAMNAERHFKAHKELYHSLVDGNDDDAARHQIFYDEYMAVMDLTAEFYLQTVERVFINHDLPNGTYRHRGALIDPAVVTKTGLMTVEGERDDISGVGQTQAAHDIFVNIPAGKKLHHLQMDVGHYGVFSGSKFRAEVAPKIKAFFKTLEK